MGNKESTWSGLSYISWGESGGVVCPLAGGVLSVDVTVWFLAGCHVQTHSTVR